MLEIRRRAGRVVFGGSGSTVTDQIIDLAARRAAKTEPQEQHASGEAFCFACNHNWVAVVATGTTEFQCPSCLRVTGRYKFGFYPNVDQIVRACNCGNQLFYLTPDGHLCASCGIYQRYNKDGS